VNGLIFLLDQAGVALQRAHAEIEELRQRIAELEMRGAPTPPAGDPDE
jgi:BMFP domain-containing protein YqiC